MHISITSQKKLKNYSIMNHVEHTKTSSDRKRYKKNLKNNLKETCVFV